MSTTFKIPDVVALRLTDFGIEPAAVLRTAGLPPGLLTAGKGMVTTEQFFSFWSAIQELSDDPRLGIRMATTTPSGQFPPMAIAAQHSRTFRDALQRLSRYKQLCCAEEMLITEGPEESRVEYRWLFSHAAPPEVLLDGAFAHATETGRRGSGQPLRPLRLELRRGSEHRVMMEEYYGCVIHFRAERDAIVFRTRDLDLPFTTYNEALLEMLSPQLDKQLAERKQSRSPAAQVKWVLKRLLGGTRPDIKAVARELGVSSRTLQRRIIEEGTNFRNLLSETRREMARHYLAQPALELSETAFLLGYEDPNSFFRAFREWEGTTPGEWRAANPPRGH